MRKASVHELHIHTSELVREAAEGGIIVIERRGEPVAELRPITTPSLLADDKKAQILDSMQAIWARMPQVTDSTKIAEAAPDRGSPQRLCRAAERVAHQQSEAQPQSWIPRCAHRRSGLDGERRGAAEFGVRFRRHGTLLEIPSEVFELLLERGEIRFQFCDALAIAEPMFRRGGRCRGLARFFHVARQ